MTSSSSRSTFTRTRQVVGLIGWLALSVLVISLGAWASIDARDVYTTLQQPAWAPPGWLFGPMWTTLYTLMAIAAWRVWRKGGFSVQKRPLSLYLLQLAVNGLWSWLFFAWFKGLWALIDVSLLWALILATLITFWRIDKPASLLLLPYLAWVTLATALNAAVWLLNPAALG
ncbi:TspO/MBR family protein [Larsenimonas rhizosphaerae]|uniref:Tryptophan-rich sensory protein n=1 Tax=Larsenimonas rhizosphaerae TaxID=2944682 RepID=A0AA41ZFI2_9GAMM|nr:TspO/MBR family protein [Larsenimonas rhizosphaerae]MCX2522948.1 tryptophan-rich sensory protein [Larsenimonas rhizosphaerae]